MGNYSMSIADIEAAIKKQDEYKSGNVGYTPKTDKLPTLKKVVEKPVEAKTTSVDLPKANSSALPDMNLAILSKPETNNDKIERWLNPSYKMSKEEKKEAKKLSDAFMSEVHNRKFDGSDEEYKRMTDLYNKSHTGAAVMAGIMDAVPFYDSVMDAALKAAGVDGSFSEHMDKTSENTRKQNPVAYTAANIGTNIGEYALGTKALEALGVLGKGGKLTQGVSKVVKNPKLASSVANVLGDTSLDVALDTIPSAVENAQSGMNGADVAKEAAKNVATNLAFNVAGEGISQVADILKRKGSISDEEIKGIANGVVSKKYNDFNFEKKSDAQIIAERDSLIEQFKRFANGEMRPDEYFVFGDTPKYMDVLGDTSVPLVASQSNLFKSVYPENYMGGKHNVGFDAVAELTRAYNEPVVLMDSLTHPGKSGMVVTDLKDAHTGQPISTPIHMGKNTSMGKVNEVASIQGRHNISNLVDRSNVIFADNQRVHDVLSGNRLQLPNLKESADPMINHSISTSQDAVKAPSKTMAEDIGLRTNNAVDKPVAPGVDENISIEVGMNKYGNSTALKRTDYDDSVKKMLIEDPQFYEVAKNAETVEMAEEIINNSSADVAYSEFLRHVETKDPVAIAMGYRLAKQYGASGNAAMAVEIVQKMSSELTKSGQFTQAAAIDLLKENPMSAMRYMEKQINKMNQTGAKKYGKKWMDFNLSDEEVKAFAAIEPNDTEAIKGLYESITNRIAKEYPSTMWEKVVEASKTAMMLNPRTHLRNVAANAIMSPVRSLGDRVSALGQNAVKLFNPDMTITQSLVGGSKAQKKIAEEIFDESIMPLLKNTDKWEDATNSILHSKQVFKDSKMGSLSKKVSVGTLSGMNKLTGGRLEKLVELADDKMTGSIMENIRKFDYWLLGDIEDDVFVKKNFSNRLASYMKAQGIDSAENVPAEAISIAYEEALKATFKDDNNITRAFSGLKKNTGKFGEVILPFTKTPANIAARGLDYSPYGVVNAIKQAKNGEEISTIIDTVSKSTIGTGGIALGYLLAKEGLVQGALSTDKDQQQFEKQQGKQAFSINVNGQYYTYDWAQPAAIPIIIGSAIYDGIKESDGEVDSLFNIGLQATKAGVDAWADLSPVSSLQDILGGGTYSSDSVADNVANEILEFPQRLYPAALTATAKTMDPTYRQTYTKGDVLQTQIDTLKSKIPVLSKDLPVSYDTWGNERKRQDSTESAAFANFVNPGSLGYDASTPLDGEIERLFEATQSKSVFPNKAEWSVKAANGKTIDLTNQQYSDYQKTMGQTSYEFAEAFMQSDMYANMSDEDKADKLSTLYSVAKSMAKSDLFGSPTSEENLKYINAYKQGGTQGLMDYIQEKYTLDSAGISSTNEIAKEYYANGNFDEYQEINNAIKSYGFDTNDSSSMKFINQYGLDAYKDAGDAIEQLGMKQSSENRKLYMSGGLPVLRMAKAADNNNDGSVSKKNELIPYLKNQSWSAEEKNRVVEQFGFSTKNLKW